MGLGAQPRQVKALLARWPAAGWTRCSAGDGATGPRGDAWRWLPLAEPLEPGWHRWRLVRRRLRAPLELTASGVCAPPATPLQEVVRVAGSRWTVESGFEAATGDVGLDQYAVRSGTAWDSADHPRDVGVGPADRQARRDDRRRGVNQKSATAPGGEPTGGVQGPAWPRLPLSVPERRRLL